MSNLQAAINLSTVFMSPLSLQKRNPYSQAFRLNRICSNPNSFDRRYNDLEKWVIEGSYNEQEVWKQILKPRGFSSNSLLDRENTWEEQNKITSNLTYHSVFVNF